MKYADIKPLDANNSPGVGSSLFVSGCTHNCEGCFNKEAQNFNYGTEWTRESEDYFIKCLNHPQVVHANVLGGEPMQQDSNIMLRLFSRIKMDTNCKIWVWTGCLFEDLIKQEDKLELLQYIDVLVDGKFEIDKKDIGLKYRGSYNQRVIDVRESLELGRISLAYDPKFEVDSWEIWKRGCGLIETDR